jgi:GntR family transcriptional regulator
LPTTFAFHIQARSGEAIYRQLIRQVKQALTTRTLNAGDRMPTIRGLATELGINPNTVARAYHELEREGLLETGVGRGTFVRAGTLPKSSHTRLRPAARRARIKPLVDRLVSEARSVGLSATELQGLVLKAVRERPRLATRRSGGPS